MIDGPTYRLSERLARSRSPSWMLKNTQSVPFAEGSSFPRGFDSNSQLAELVDIFHEGFFEPFIDEWFGLTRDQFASFVDALTDCLHFQKKSFPANRPLVPFASMAAQFSVYEKLIRIDPTFSSVAEIGPGAGYLAFFLKNHPSLKRYDAVESAEAFYVYQTMIYDHCFPLLHNHR